MKPSFISPKLNKGTRGFVLPLTLIVCTIILAISSGISIILSRELYFSKLSRQSQLAYYAADNALMCTLMVDDHYVNPSTGIGIFEYDSNNLVTAQTVLASINTDREARGYAPITLTDVECATSKVFDVAEGGYTVVPFVHTNGELGKTTRFSMRMDLGDGGYRCAKVEINKTPSYRQIIARGFASCATNGTFPVERAVVNTSKR